MPIKKLKTSSNEEFKHRGRIQAQGEKLDESEAWSQNEPPTKNEGIEMAEKLKNKIPAVQATIREGAFDALKRFIIQAAKNGGVSAFVSKSFDVKGTEHERVDLEVRKGIAFIDV